MGDTLIKVATSISNENGMFKISSYSSLPVSVSQWSAYSRLVVLNTLHRGQRDTILCPYLVHFAMLYFSLPLYQPRSLPIFPRHCSPPSLSASTSAAALYLAPFRSIPALSCHHIPTCSPDVLSISSHRSRINIVAMNCATMLFLLQMYSSIASKTASSLAAAAEVYSHLLSCRHCRSLRINCRAIFYWKSPGNRPVWGVTIQASAPKSSTDWTTALNTNLDTRGEAPSLLIILVSLRHTACALSKFLTNAGQSFSTAEITRPNYLKDVTISRGRPYVLKALEMTALCSSSARRRLFCSAPFLH